MVGKAGREVGAVYTAQYQAMEEEKVKEETAAEKVAEG